MTSCTFEDLHPEIVELIFSYLDTRSLLSACRVNRTWYRWISSDSKLWRKPCLSVGLQIKDEKDVIFSRALFVNLSGRKRSLEADCLRSSSYIDRNVRITAIYYYGGRLATNFRDGVIRLWDCTGNELTAYNSVCLWTSLPHDACVTSIKFDDHIVVAAYGDGSIAAWCTSTGQLRRTYANPCVNAVTVDYMTEANLVVSAHDAVVVWNMSTGQLLEKQTLRHKPEALKVVVGSYPEEEYKLESHGIRRSLIACLNQKYVFVWVATYKGENQSEMNFVMQFLREICVACRKLIGYYGTDSLLLDGKYLYFTKHSRTVCQYDVINGCKVNIYRLPLVIKLLLGVGKKYMLMILTVSTGEDRLVVMERESCNLIIRTEHERPVKMTAFSFHGPTMILPEEILPCIGEKSWLDGFDGDNDKGMVYASVSHPSWVNITSWSPRMDFWR